MNVIIIILEKATKIIFVMKVDLELHYGYDISDDLFQTYSTTVIRVIFKINYACFFCFCFFFSQQSWSFKEVEIFDY